MVDQDYNAPLFPRRVSRVTGWWYQALFTWGISALGVFVAFTAANIDAVIVSGGAESLVAIILWGVIAVVFGAVTAGFALLATLPLRLWTAAQQFLRTHLTLVLVVLGMALLFEVVAYLPGIATVESASLGGERAVYHHVSPAAPLLLAGYGLAAVCASLIWLPGRKTLGE